MSEAVWPDATYDAGLREGELKYQECTACASVAFPPRQLCPSCSEEGLVWKVSAGLGVIHSSTVVNSRKGAYNVVLADLDEGFRLMSTVIDSTEVEIGTRVRCQIEETDNDQFRPVFTIGERND